MAYKGRKRGRMKNKCCNQEGVNVCVHVNGCCTSGEKTDAIEKPEAVSCTCIPTLKLTIGTGGDFSTLTEALGYAKTVVHNRLIIEMVSDVVETRTTTIWVDIRDGFPQFTLLGNGHQLDLSKINSSVAIGIYCGTSCWIHDVTILAPNVTRFAICVRESASLYVRNHVKIIGNQNKNSWGYYAYWSGNIVFEEEGNAVENFNIGIRAFGNGNATIVNPITFTNVTTEYSPAKNTLGNSNSYINVQY